MKLKPTFLYACNQHATVIQILLSRVHHVNGVPLALWHVISQGSSPGTKTQAYPSQNSSMHSYNI